MYSKEQQSEYWKEWYKNNKDSKRAYWKKYSEKNRDKINERQRKLREKVTLCPCGKEIKGYLYKHKKSKYHQLYEKMLNKNIIDNIDA
jgi:hypothetical protein